MVAIKTLVVIDMQNDFITGVFGTPEAQEIVPRVRELIKQYVDESEAYTNIICTQDTHFPDTYEENVEHYLPIHCLIGTEGHDLEDSINELVEAYPEEIKVINKFTFGSIKLAETISEYMDYLIDSLKKEGVRIDQIHPVIEIVGLCTDICVISNALILKASMPYATVMVSEHFCAGTTPENHQKALDIMKQNGIIVQ